MSRAAKAASAAHSLTGQAEFDIQAFAKGFVSALVEGGTTSLQPKHTQQRLALLAVWQFLGQEVERTKRAPLKREWFNEVVRLRNAMAPGPTGAHDQFETALRDLQLSFTESPNPHYDDILFTVSRPFAQSELERLNQPQKKLVREAARIFLDLADKRTDDRFED